MPIVGETVLAYVLSSEDQEGRVVLSLTRARAERGWRNLQKRFEEGQTVEGEVVEHNKGGLIVNVEGVRGFVPLSQIVDLRRWQRGRVGEKRARGEGRNAAPQGHRDESPAQPADPVRARGAPGAAGSREGPAARRAAAGRDPARRGVQHCDFGAFVDLGGADGLIHLSELSWGQVQHPSQVVKVGQEVDVHVVGVDRENKKIALSLKRSQGEPVDAHRAEVPRRRDRATAKITKLAQFGAFAEIEPASRG